MHIRHTVQYNKLLHTYCIPPTAYSFFTTTTDPTPRGTGPAWDYETCQTDTTCDHVKVRDQGSHTKQCTTHHHHTLPNLNR